MSSKWPAMSTGAQSLRNNSTHRPQLTARQTRARMEWPPQRAQHAARARRHSPAAWPRPRRLTAQAPRSPPAPPRSPQQPPARPQQSRRTAGSTAASASAGAGPLATAQAGGGSGHAARGSLFLGCAWKTPLYRASSPAGPGTAGEAWQNKCRRRQALVALQPLAEGIHSFTQT